MITIKTSYGIENIDDALSVRITVFVHEQGFIDGVDDIDSVSHQVIAYDDIKTPIACARVFHYKDDIYKIGRVAVLKEYRGQNLGVKIMNEAHRVIASIGGKYALLGSQCRAREFYEKCGYEAFGDIYDEEGCPHINMKLKLSS